MVLSALLSVAGNAAAVILIPWLVLRNTGNAAFAGLVGSIALVAGIVSLAFGAAIVDRWDKRWLSSVADILSAIALLAIPVGEYFTDLGVATLAVLVFLGALFDAPGRSAREAMRPQIARDSGLSLDRTNAMGELADSIGLIIGSAGTGVIVALVGLNTAFVIAACFTLIAGLVYFATQQPSKPVRQSEASGAISEALGGIRTVFKDPILRISALTGTVFGFIFAPFMLVLTAEFERQDKSMELGVLMALFAVGSIVGNVGFAAVSTRIRRRSALAVGNIVSAVGIFAMAYLLEDLLPLQITLFVIGVFVGPIGPVYSVLIQERTSEENRGRVIASIGVLEMIAAPLAVGISGVIIEASSPAIMFYILATLSAVATVWTLWHPALRRIESEDLAKLPKP